jgi:hypothetical protein
MSANRVFAPPPRGVTVAGTTSPDTAYGVGRDWSADPRRNQALGELLAAGWFGPKVEVGR